MPLEDTAIIVIVDYGMGNLHSVLHKTKKLRAEVVISSCPRDVLAADKIILPGVGHFGKAVEQLHQRDLFAAVDTAVREQGTPILGICLGMQLLTRHSEEGDAEGFGWIEAVTKRFRFEEAHSQLKLPHIGWNQVAADPGNPLFRTIQPAKASFYFVHSFHVECARRADVAARAHYGYGFDCAVHHRNIFGTQFHPEKSHGAGMQTLANFLSVGTGTSSDYRPRSQAVSSARDDQAEPASAAGLNSGVATTLQHRIIPCLLLRGQGLVKTVKFKNPKYVGDPINAVRIFNTKEVDELIFLDIMASREGRGPNLRAVESIAQESFMPLTVGGGVRSVDQIRDLLNAGAEKVAINTAAIEHPALIGEAAAIFGRQCIVAAIDVRKKWRGGHEVVLRGGSRATGLDPVTVAQQMEQQGAGEILVNSIDRDGTMKGYDLPLIQRVAESVEVPVIACGGAGTTQDLVTAIDQAGASAVAAGSLFVFHGPRRAVLISFPSKLQIAQARAA